MSARLPLCRPLSGPLDLALWAAAAAGEHHLAWLDGDGGATPRGRMSFLTWNPHRTLSAHGTAIVEEWWDAEGSRIARREYIADPLAALDRALASEADPTAIDEDQSDEDPRWHSGAVITLGFELADRIERHPTLPAPPPGDPFGGWPDLTAAFYDSVLALDEATGRLWLAARLARDRPASGVLSTFERTQDRVNAIRPATPSPASGPIAVQAHTPAPARYREQVAAIQGGIAAGEVYQVNLSRALRAPWPAPPLALFTRHRALGRMPHGAYLDLGRGQAVASFSPERLAARRGRRVSTSPIKGTRPRMAAFAADRRQREDLLASAKDRAEHLMIVDLERNDLGRICEPGSIHVAPLFGVESYTSVHHLVSTVHGMLAPGIGPLELLRAVFPGGSVTGAPKIAAIDFLRRLEGEPRRLYTGALGYWDAGGDLDLALPIRTALVHQGELEYRVGGGIVIDSDAELEWRETEDKAGAFLAVLRAAGSELGLARAER